MVDVYYVDENKGSITATTEKIRGTKGSAINNSKGEHFLFTYDPIVTWFIHATWMER